MGIHGIFKQIGPGERVSLVKLSADHYTKTGRPLRLAIDTSIWLFQILSGKGGSNPALRTFYYRLLRLLSLNIHPLFVFDGPNKPTFKRNKKVGGPGVRVASVPEFLAKQLLKEFGFPWHVAPGEAEAECAVLQNAGVVDAVLSEDVDTLMFGSGMTLKNWSAENTSKTPTHVNVYRADTTKNTSGMDREGMILVALMSGGDYLPEGIPGCGPIVACNAARAGFGKRLCGFDRKDRAALKSWKDELEHEIRTNESKFFSRRTPSFTMPEGFPNLEVLGYYTHPCVSTPDKIQRLKGTLQWDLEIDFPALRSFAGDAFDWRCLGGAKKFIRNLAPAILVRTLRQRGESNETRLEADEDQAERSIVKGVHGKRNHATTDGSLEFRISFRPVDFVPIDLSIEEEDDDHTQAGGDTPDVDSDAEDLAHPRAGSDYESDNGAPASPSKRKRVARPYDPSELEKLWIMKPFLQIGCPLLVEDYEATSRNARAAADAKAKAKADKANRSKGTKSSKHAGGMANDALMSYVTVVKPTTSRGAEDMAKGSAADSSTLSKSLPSATEQSTRQPTKQPTFRMPFTQSNSALFSTQSVARLDASSTGQMEDSRSANTTQRTLRPSGGDSATTGHGQKTPRRRKRRQPNPATPTSQRKVTSYYSSPSRGGASQQMEYPTIISLLSSSPARPRSPPPFDPACRGRDGTQPLNLATEPSSILEDHKSEQQQMPTAAEPDSVWLDLPSTVTKRRRREPLKRFQTAPVTGSDDYDNVPILDMTAPDTPGILVLDRTTDAMDLASPTKRQPQAIVILDDDDEDDDVGLPSPESLLLPTRSSTSRARTNNTARHGPVNATSTCRAIPAATTVTTSMPEPHAALRRRSPKQAASKKLIMLRPSLPGSWKEVDVDEVDLSGNGVGLALAQGRPLPPGYWRKSEVEVLDLTNV